MKFLVGLTAAAAALTLVVSPSQAADTITFEGIASFDDPIVVGDFTIGFSANGWGVFGAGDNACCDVVYNGTQALYANGGSDGLSQATMTLTAGGTFDVFGLDASVYHTGVSSGTLIVTGVKSGGGSVVQNLALTGSWSAYALVGFEDLISLSFADSSPAAFLDAPGWGVDNIVLTSGAVPEPATWAMMIGGFGLAGALLRRRALVSA